MDSKLVGLAGIVCAVTVALGFGLSDQSARVAVDGESQPRVQHSVLASDEGPGTPNP